MPAPASVPVKAADVNWLPWSVLKISGRPKRASASTGYALHSLEAALWYTTRAASFKGAILAAANLGHDSDTTAAINGQIAGAGDVRQDPTPRTRPAMQ